MVETSSQSRMMWYQTSKITFKVAEANVNDDKSDESVLDRDIKELVYLLRSSGTKIVVLKIQIDITAHLFIQSCEN